MNQAKAFPTKVVMNSLHIKTSFKVSREIFCLNYIRWKIGSVLPLNFLNARGMKSLGLASSYIHYVKGNLKIPWIAILANGV